MQTDWGRKAFFEILMSTHGIKWASDSRNKMGQINIIKQAQLLGNWATSCIDAWENGSE
jgi:hypothetical protein